MLSPTHSRHGNNRFGLVDCCELERNLSPPAWIPVSSHSLDPSPCSVGKHEAEATVGQRVVTSSAWRSSTQTVQVWLMEWEQRQRLQLQEHQEATAMLVESLREDITKRLETSVSKRGVLPTTQQRSKDDPGARDILGARSQVQEAVASLTEGKLVTPMTPLTPLPPQFTSSGERLRANVVPSRNSTGSSFALGKGSKEALGALVGKTSLLYRNANSAGGGSSLGLGGGAGDTYEDAFCQLKPRPAVRGRQSVFSSVSNVAFSKTHSFEYEPTNRVQDILLKIVHSALFQSMTGLIVMVYALIVAVQSDLEMRLALGGNIPNQIIWIELTDLIFGLIFALEVLLRLLAERLWYFKGPGRCWNIFDGLLVCTSFVEIMDVLDLNLSVLRIVRTVGAVRVLRIFRIFRFFRELRLMAASIVSCLVSLTWAFVLLLTVQFMFAVVLLQGAGNYLKNLDTVVDPDLEHQLSEDFGDIWRSIYSLTLAVSGGRSWGEFAAPYMKISPWYGLIFVLFAVFVIFGVLNVLTGVFVESTHSLASVDKELAIQEEMSQNEAMIKEMRTLFEEIDADKSGTLTFKELRRNLTDPRVKAYFSLLQMDVSEAQSLFQLLDKDESGEVSIEEFIMSCMRLKGQARSIDMAAVLLDTKRLHSLIRSYMMTTDETLANISAAVSKNRVSDSFHGAA